MVRKTRIRLTRLGLFVIPFTAAILLIGSCGENPTEPEITDPGSNTNPPETLADFDGTISDPIAQEALETAPTRAQIGSIPNSPVLSAVVSADDSLSFVSLQPGSLSEADSVQIHNRDTGAQRSASVVGGGFDPVAIPATVGDTIVVIPFMAQKALPGLGWAVPARRPPVVVRTQPPEGKTKVPLNSIVVIVFSEPIVGGSVTKDNLRLQRGGLPVTADMTLDEERLRVELRPDVQLSPGSEYTLIVGTGVTDLSGDPLEQETAITFSTTDATLSVTPLVASIAVGVRLQLTARLTNPVGGSETLPAVAWSTSDPSVATVSGAGAVTGVGQGSAIISATIEGQEAAATVTVITASGSTFAELTAGRDHTCGLTVDGLAYCWGSNEYGQLGDGAGGVGISQLLPVSVAGGHAFSMLAAGTDHTCGLTTSNTILCWGRNDQGQLGDESHADKAEPTPVAGPNVFVALTAGLDHTCARSTSDTYCWGRNIDAILGAWTESSSPLHIGTAGVLTWAPIDFGARREESLELTCPVIMRGLAELGTALFCWGQPPAGRIALDLATLSVVNATGSLARVVEFQLGLGTTCSVTLGGGAYCTRDSADLPHLDFEHENGLGVEVCVGASCSVPGFDVSYWYLHGISGPDPLLDLGISLTVNGDKHSCGLTSDGAVYCWGEFDRGQLGRSVTDPVSDPPTGVGEVGLPEPVVGNLGFATLAAGEQHTCGVSRTGDTYCWGANGSGQLGDGSQADRNEPVRVSFPE